ncbi:MAG: RdgB/HAM1 family non-canonical purine NTP pyrophosphatase [Alphaproteobacteria bacterium]|nr:RdgB/HAM1 family non-canonical purine NTP pyrophosphatase [Alphaproteobacteria bacterium]
MTRKFSGPELVVATHNQGKLAEISEMLRGRNIKLYAASDFGLESPPETGTTFIENSLLKARFVASATGKIALADDSGICVDALGGAPGVYTADWAEEPGARDFNYAMKKIHDGIGNDPDRRAHFVSVLTLCWPDGHCETVEGFAHGKIIWPPRGQHGHGCDPVFMPDGYDITYAEMAAAEKNRISHRAEAFRKMIDKCFR